MSKKQVKILVAVVVLALLILLCVFGKKMGLIKDENSIVYLTTGEVYVGKLSTFGGFQLKDGYILQMTQDPTDETKTNFQLNPIKDALWAPKVLNIIKKNIVFYGPLSPESSIAKTLAEQVK